MEKNVQTEFFHLFLTICIDVQSVGHGQCGRVMIRVLVCSIRNVWWGVHFRFQLISAQIVKLLLVPTGQMLGSIISTRAIYTMVGLCLVVMMISHFGGGWIFLVCRMRRQGWLLGGWKRLRGLVVVMGTVVGFVVDPVGSVSSSLVTVHFIFWLAEFCKENYWLRLLFLVVVFPRMITCCSGGYISTTCL